MKRPSAESPTPASWQWQDILADLHPYQPLPHDAAVIHTLRTIGGGGKPLWLSEYGVGSAVDLVRLARQYEQRGKTGLRRRGRLSPASRPFLADWDRWRLADTFANPEDYFRQCLAWMAGLRELGINAIRANPNVIGYSLTGTQDQGLTGEGLTTTFRELKPGTIDAMADAFAPLRWCLFVEPVQVYRGHKARFEAVLANEDVLARGRLSGPDSGRGPAGGGRLRPDDHRPRSRPQRAGPEPPFAMPVFAREIPIDGPAGQVPFSGHVPARRRRRPAATSTSTWPIRRKCRRSKREVVLWGEDGPLGEWLGRQRHQDASLRAGPPASRGRVILAGDSSGRRAAGGVSRVGPAHRPGLERGFPFPRGLRAPAATERIGCRWRRRAAASIFDTGFITRTIGPKNIPFSTACPPAASSTTPSIGRSSPSTGWTGQDVPDEVVAGAINTALGYRSGLSVAVYRLGAGRFIFNTLRIRENLGSDPVVERLLRNMLRHAARDCPGRRPNCRRTWNSG